MDERGSKTRRIINEVDRISGLPDEILCHILSFLPTKYAVATSILSHRWTDIWTKTPALRFHDEHHLDKDKSKFMCFVDKVLARYGSPYIENFQICYTDSTKDQLSRINDVVRYAISHKVVELDIQLYFNNMVYQPEIGLRLEPCDSLEVFKINADICLLMPSLGCFKYLKKFHIELLYDADNELTSKLFSSLPQLEELKMFLGDMANCTDINIAAPLLKVLDVNLRGESYSFHELPSLEILIDAPMLEYLAVGDNFLGSYRFKSLSASFQANISVGRHTMSFDYEEGLAHANRAIELIRGLSSAKSLVLDEDTLTAVNYAYRGNLPILHNLTKLEIVVDSSHWNLLVHILKSAPNLEVIVLYMKGDMHVDLQEDSDWRMAKNLPSCSLLHLKKLVIRRSVNWKGVKGLKHIIKHAKVHLNKLKVDFVSISSNWYAIKLKD